MMIARITKLYQDKAPVRHEFYKHIGKVGTTATTVVWLIDAPDPKEGDKVYFVNESDNVYPDKKQCYMKYLSEHQYHRGIIDIISPDGYMFISLI